MTQKQALFRPEKNEKPILYTIQVYCRHHLRDPITLDKWWTSAMNCNLRKVFSPEQFVVGTKEEMETAIEGFFQKTNTELRTITMKVVPVRQP